MQIHPSLHVFRLQNPHAEIRLNGRQLWWMDSGRENSITFFEDHELPHVRVMARNANDISLVGNLRFSSTI